MKNRRAILFFLAWSLVFALALVMLSLGRHPVAEVSRTTLSSFNADKISHLEIIRALPDGGKSERILLSRTDGRWRLESPLAAEAEVRSPVPPVSVIAANRKTAVIIDTFLITVCFIFI